MFEELRVIFAKQLRLQPEEVNMDSRIKEDLHADSLDILEVLMTLELDYGVAIPDESLSAFKTVGDVVTYVDANKK